MLKVKNMIGDLFVELVNFFYSTFPKEIGIYTSKRSQPEELLITLKYIKDLLDKFCCSDAQTDWIEELFSEILSATNEILGLDIFSGPESKKITSKAALILYEYFYKCCSQFSLIDTGFFRIEKALSTLKKFSEN